MASQEVQSKRIEFFRKPGGADISYHFNYDMPELPVEPKWLNIDPCGSLEYQITHLEVNRNRVNYYINPLLDLDLVDDSVYDLKPHKDMEFSSQELELAEYALGIDLGEGTSESKEDSSYNFDQIYGHEAEDNIVRKLNLKSKSTKVSRYQKLADEEGSLYLRKTDIPTQGLTKYGNAHIDPVKTYVDESSKDFDSNQLFQAGDKLTQKDVETITELIQKSFNSVKTIKVGSEKPGSRGKVVAKK